MNFILSCHVSHLKHIRVITKLYNLLMGINGLNEGKKWQGAETTDDYKWCCS